MGSQQTTFFHETLPIGFIFVAYVRENRRYFIRVRRHFLCLAQQIIGGKIAVQLFADRVNVKRRAGQADSLRAGGKDNYRRRIDAGNIYRPYRAIQQLQEMKKLNGNVNVPAGRRNIDGQRGTGGILFNQIFYLVYKSSNVFFVDAAHKADFYICVFHVKFLSIHGTLRRIRHTGAGATDSTQSKAISGATARTTSFAIHICRFMFSNHAVDAAVFSKFEFESFKCVRTDFHFIFAPFLHHEKNGAAICLPTTPFLP